MQYGVEMNERGRQYTELTVTYSEAHLWTHKVLTTIIDTAIRALSVLLLQFASQTYGKWGQKSPQLDACVGRHKVDF